MKNYLRGYIVGLLFLAEALASVTAHGHDARQDIAVTFNLPTNAVDWHRVSALQPCCSEFDDIQGCVPCSNSVAWKYQEPDGRDYAFCALMPGSKVIRRPQLQKVRRPKSKTLWPVRGKNRYGLSYLTPRYNKIKARGVLPKRIRIHDHPRRPSAFRFDCDDLTDTSESADLMEDSSDVADHPEIIATSDISDSVESPEFPESTAIAKPPRGPELVQVEEIPEELDYSEVLDVGELPQKPPAPPVSSQLPGLAGVFVRPQVTMVPRLPTRPKQPRAPVGPLRPRIPMLPPRPQLHLVRPTLPKRPLIPRPQLPELPPLPPLPEMPPSPPLPKIPAQPSLPDFPQLPTLSPLPPMPELPEMPQPPPRPKLPRIPRPQFSELPPRPQLSDLPPRPQLSELPPRPQLPELPPLPPLPKFPELPALPHFPKRPSRPELPELPSLPKLPQRPRLPALPKLQRPNLPAISRPQLPAISRPRLPAISRPQLIEMPRLPVRPQVAVRPVHFPALPETIGMESSQELDTDNDVLIIPQADVAEMEDVEDVLLPSIVGTDYEDVVSSDLDDDDSGDNDNRNSNLNMLRKALRALKRKKRPHRKL